MYPPKGFDEYWVQYQAFNNNGVHSTELFGETIPDSIDFISRSWYTLNDNNANHFSISFKDKLSSAYTLG